MSNEKIEPVKKPKTPKAATKPKPQVAKAPTKAAVKATAKSSPLTDFVDKNVKKRVVAKKVATEPKSQSSVSSNLLRDMQQLIAAQLS